MTRLQELRENGSVHIIALDDPGFTHLYESWPTLFIEHKVCLHCEQAMKRLIAFCNIVKRNHAEAFPDIATLPSTFLD